ncbi:MAG: hypothetical protein J6U23_00030 [Clostridiales bacterium]|nr:hypothetical protein [Clostridiales bacterium]
MKLKILASLLAAAFLLTACNYTSTKETAAPSGSQQGGDVTASSDGTGSSDGTKTTYATREGASDNLTFMDLVAYMKDSDAIKTWFSETSSLDGFEGECWYDIPELQKICDAEISGDDRIKNYTSFHIYYSSTDQIVDEVTYVEIFEIDKESTYYSYVQQNGAIEFDMKVPFRDYDGFDSEKYLAEYHDMTTAERLLFSYDASGNPVMNPDTISVNLPIHGLNGRFVIVIHSGIDPDGQAVETFSADNERGQAIVDAFMSFGG